MRDADQPSRQTSRRALAAVVEHDVDAAGLEFGMQAVGRGLDLGAAVQPIGQITTVNGAIAS